MPERRIGVCPCAPYRHFTVRARARSPTFVRVCVRAEHTHTDFCLQERENSANNGAIELIRFALFFFAILILTLLVPPSG